MTRKLLLCACSLSVTFAGALSLVRDGNAASAAAFESCPTGTTCPARPGCEVCGQPSCEAGVGGEIWVSCRYACGGSACPA